MAVSFYSMLSSQLFRLATDLGKAAINIQLGAPLRVLEGMAERVSILEKIGISHRDLDGLFQYLESGQRIAEREIETMLLRNEGRILGELVRHNALPEQQRDRFERELAGIDQPTLAGIQEAYRRIQGPWIDAFLAARGIDPIEAPSHIKTTPMDPFDGLSQAIKRTGFLKLENHQQSGSVKIRGATNLLLGALLLGRDPKRIRLITASESVVQAARNLGFHEIDLYLPKTAVVERVNRLRKMGARVVQVGQTLDDAEDMARAVAEKEIRALYIPRTEHPLVVMGQGSIGVEIEFQMATHYGLPHYAVVVPAGSGALLAGVSTYLSSLEIPVYGVQSQKHCNLKESFQIERPIQGARRKSPGFYMADAIAVDQVSEPVLSLICHNVKDMVAIPEVHIGLGIQFFDKHDIVADGAAAAPLAAVLFGGLSRQLNELPPNMPIVLVHTGENISPELHRWIVEQPFSDQNGVPILNVEFLPPSSVRPAVRGSAPPKNQDSRPTVRAPDFRSDDEDDQE